MEGRSSGLSAQQSSISCVSMGGHAEGGGRVGRRPLTMASSNVRVEWWCWSSYGYRPRTSSHSNTPKEKTSELTP